MARLESALYHARGSRLLIGDDRALGSHICLYHWSLLAENISRDRANKLAHQEFRAILGTGVLIGGPESPVQLSLKETGEF
ncbi:MAG: hypothetical protein ACREXR_14275, partial [Gammaproteobacteria bacterium]